jgi:hypothetical protein
MLRIHSHPGLISRRNTNISFGGATVWQRDVIATRTLNLHSFILRSMQGI